MENGLSPSPDRPQIDQQFFHEVAESKTSFWIMMSDARLVASTQ
jgi:hypothetical protein